MSEEHKPLTDAEKAEQLLDEERGRGSLEFERDKAKHLSQLVTPAVGKALSEWMLMDADELDSDPEIQAVIQERNRRARLTVEERIREDGLVNPPSIEAAQRELTKKVWQNLCGKCNDTRNLHYRHWGARGVKMHKAWGESLDAFISDVGLCPSPLYELRRLDPANPHFEPGNAAWLERTGRTYREDGKHPGGRPRKGQQALLEYEGKMVTMPELSQLTGIKLSTIRARYTAGKTMAQILSPVRENATGEAWVTSVIDKTTGQPVIVTLKEMCEAKRMPYATVKARLKRGIPLSMAFDPRKSGMSIEERRYKQRAAYHARKNKEQQENNDD